MAVVVQQMLFPQAAGVLFTADPVTSNRKIASVQATVGLGEAVVSGPGNADVYTVRDGDVVSKAIASKQAAIRPSPAGGTRIEPIGPEQQGQPALRTSRSRSSAGGPERTSAAPRTSSGVWSRTASTSSRAGR